MEWIEHKVKDPQKEVIQTDGRIKRWAYIQDKKNYLRVILLPDGKTVHNAFFDRRFKGIQ
jgi:hypothetical protein